MVKDWANPLVAKHIHRYPVMVQDGVISEVWNGRKWRHDLDRHLMSPMYDAGNGKHYFIDEPARLTNGQMIIPVRWLEDESGTVYCDAWEIKLNEQSVRPLFTRRKSSSWENKLSKIKDEMIPLVASSELEYNMLDLQDMSIMPDWCPETIASGHVSRMPNPDRALANGNPIYSSFIDVLVMMYLGTGQRVGISTGTFILLIKIYCKNYY